MSEKPINALKVSYNARDMSSNLMIYVFEDFPKRSFPLLEHVLRAMEMEALLFF